MMTESEALLVLNAVTGIGNARIRALLEHYGCAASVLSLKAKDPALDSILSSKVADNMFSFSKDRFLDQERRLMEEHGVRVITFKDEDYPQSLQKIPDAPAVIYVKGCLPGNLPLSVALVGSRRASVYGISVAQQFAFRLAEVGVVVISGMARGIDTAAHRGALRARGKTVAVLGCGLNHTYPPENGKLMDEIVESGAVVSEFPMDALPLPHNFPRRNRIISGLAQGVIVVEAAEKSGALITADFALEQGREVYAVPGKVDSPTSRGVNGLIKQGAKLVTCVDDILEDLLPQWRADLPPCDHPQTEEKIQNEGISGLSEQEQIVYQHITDRPVHVDHLSQRCGVDISSMTSVLLRLELKHLVKQLPGRQFVR
jgi:DNA processing protein